LQSLAHPNLYTEKVDIVYAGGRCHCGGNTTVIAVLEWFRVHGGNLNRVFGFVVRNEWDNATANQQIAALPQLRVNQVRHSLESYFCDPNEIAPCLTGYNPAWVQHVIRMSTFIHQRRPEYVDHWALFTQTERIKIQ